MESTTALEQDLEGVNDALEQSEFVSGEYKIIDLPTSPSVRGAWEHDATDIRRALFRRLMEDRILDRIALLRTDHVEETNPRNQDPEYRAFLEDLRYVRDGGRGGILHLFTWTELSSINRTFISLQLRMCVRPERLVHRTEAGLPALSDFFRDEIGAVRRRFLTGAVMRERAHHSRVVSLYQGYMWKTFDQLTYRLRHRLITWDQLRTFLYAPSHELVQRFRGLGGDDRFQRRAYEFFMERFRDRSGELGGTIPPDPDVHFRLFLDHLRWTFWSRSLWARNGEVLDLAQRWSGVPVPAKPPHK